MDDDENNYELINICKKYMEELLNKLCYGKYCNMETKIQVCF